MSSLAGLRPLLNRRHFRQLYGTRLVAQTSDGIFQVALAAFVIFTPEQQPSPQRIAAAFAVLLLPYSLVGPFAGVLLDRWRRRQVLVYCNIVRAGLLVTLAALVSTGVHGAAWVLFFCTALAALSVNRFFLAALSAALPHVVREEELVLANSLSTTSGTIVAFLGGGVGYGLRAALGPAATGTALILLTAAAAYLSSGAVALTLGRDLLGPDEKERRGASRQELWRVASGLLEGARHAWQRRQASAALGAIAGQRFCYGAVTIMTVLLFRNYFHPYDVGAGLSGVALVGAASGLGIMVAAVVTPAATRHLQLRTWVTAMLFTAGTIVVTLGTPLRQALFVAAGFALGLAIQGVGICVDTLVQTAVDDDFRGRVFSLYDMLYNASFVAAAALAAFTLPRDGASHALLALTGAGFALTAVMYWLATRPGARSREVLFGGPAT